MKVRPSLLALLGLSLMPMVSAADSVPRPALKLALKDYAPEMRDYAFPSGFRIVFQADHSQPIVSISAVIDNGSTSDPVGKEGIAHLVEHLCFQARHKGTDGKELPKVWDLLTQMGADLNAYTQNDLTNYMTVAHKDKLTAMLSLEALRMKDPIEGVTEEIVLNEREVVRNELRLNWENGGASAVGYLFAKLFPADHPYHRMTIGTHASLSAITLADVQQFLKDNYGPQYTTMLVVGDIDLDKTSDYINEAFGVDQLKDPKHLEDELVLVENPKPRVSGLSPEPPPPSEPILVKGETVGVTEEHAAVEKPVVLLGWTMPAAYRENEALMDVTARIMTSAITRELFPSWDYDQDPPVSSVGCGLWPYLSVSIALCQIEVSTKEKAHKAAETALEGLQTLWTTDEVYRQFQKYSFSYYRTYFMAQLFQSVDLFSSLFTPRVSDAANYLHYTGDPRYYNAKFNHLKLVNADSASKLAEKYLNRNRAVGVIILPYEKGDVVVDNSDSAYRGSSSQNPLDSMMDTSTITPEIIKNAVVKLDTKKVFDERLPNGVRLVGSTYTSGPLLRMEIVFRGGYDSAVEGPFARTMSTTLSNVDPLSFAGFGDENMGAMTTSWTMAAPAGTVKDALFTLRDRMDNLKPDTNGKLDWAKNGQDDVMTNLGKPDWWADQLALDHVLPGHAISKWYNHAEYDDMKGWGLDRVSGFYSRLYQPQNATIYIVGNVTAEEMREAAKTYWGTWSGWGKPTKELPALKTQYDAPPASDARHIYVVDKPLVSQTGVSLTCQLAPVTQDNLASVSVLQSVLSTLGVNVLRHELGSAYYARAQTGDYYGYGVNLLSMFTPVQNTTSAKAVQVFLDLVKEAADGKLDQRAITVMKYSLAQQYVARQQSTEQMMGRIASVLNRGWPLSYFDAYPDRLANVDAAKMAALVQPCVGKETITMLGPKEVVTPLLDQASLSYELFDWKAARKAYADKYKLKVPADKDETATDDGKKKK